MYFWLMQDLRTPSYLGLDMSNMRLDMCKYMTSDMNMSNKNFIRIDFDFILESKSMSNSISQN